MSALSTLRADILAGLRASEDTAVGDMTAEHLLGVYDAAVRAEALAKAAGMLDRVGHPAAALVLQYAEQAEEKASASTAPTATLQPEAYENLTDVAARNATRAAMRSIRRDDSDAETDPVPLRWGLDDVMYGDDDTTTLLLSGPDREPYVLELDPERTAALQDCLTGPGEPAPEPETAGSRAAKEIQALRDSSCIGYVIGVDRLQLILNPATPAEWAAWQKRLALIASRTTYRGSVATGHGTWDGVPVTVLCHLDRINAARTAPTSHADRQAYLLSVITAQGGKWATGRVDGHYRQQGWRVARSSCRGDLQALEAAGHLTEHGPVDGTYYRLNTRKDGA